MTKWIQQCITNLARCGILNTEQKSSENHLKARLLAMNGNVVDKVEEFGMGLNTEIADCIAAGRNYNKCDLHRVAKKKRCVFKEFEYKEADANTERFSMARALTVKESEKGRYSCVGCYYRQRMITLVEQLPAVVVELTLELGSHWGTQTFFLIGLEHERGHKTILGFEYKTVKDETRYVIVSCFQTSVSYLEMTKVKDLGYLVEGVRDQLPLNELNVCVFDPHELFYYNEEKMVINIGAQHWEGIEGAFVTRTDQEEVLDQAREVVEVRRGL